MMSITCIWSFLNIKFFYKHPSTKGIHPLKASCFGREADTYILY